MGVSVSTNVNNVINKNDINTINNNNVKTYADTLSKKLLIFRNTPLYTNQRLLMKIQLPKSFSS